MDNRISIRFTDEQKSKIKTLSEKRCSSFGSTVRFIVQEYLNKDVDKR